MKLSKLPAASKPGFRFGGTAHKQPGAVAKPIVNTVAMGGAHRPGNGAEPAKPATKGWGGLKLKTAPAPHRAGDADSGVTKLPQGWGRQAVPLPKLDLEEAERTYLEDRALTVAAARAAAIRAVDNALEVPCGRHALPCEVIPYLAPITRTPYTWRDRRGAERQAVRIRYLGDNVPPERGKKKPQRYRVPKGQPNFAYFAPGYDWKRIQDNREHPCILTEGEIKALCSCEHGLPVIGLSGLDNFINDGVFLPELLPYITGREVIVCPDSDFHDKPGVQAAVRRLVARLQKEGAVNVHIALLPPPPPASGLDKLGLDDAIKHLGIDPVWDLLERARPATDFKAVIDWAPARLLNTLEQLDEAFTASELPVYQRSGHPVHVAAAGSATEEDEVHRSAQAPIIREMTLTTCQQLAMQVVDFAKWNEKKKGPVPCECPATLAEHYLTKADGWQLKELSGIVEAPTIRSDGTVLQTPGYDKPSGILYLPNAEFPLIPDRPTRADALAALELLRHVVRGFEFGSPEAESVWLAAAITAVIRRSLRTAPMFAISAPVMGAGKTLAADLLGIIATGHEPAVMSQGGSPEEDSKRLLSVLLRGDSVTQIDNCERPIEGDALCSILTSPEWQCRILGRSEMSKVRTNTTFIATGNNLTFKGDMSTRALMCKLLPKVERPEERIYGWDAREETRSHRPQLIAAALTIIRAYYVAGCPDMAAKPFGRFEQWQAVIQAPLLWLGSADPCKSRELVERNDPDRETFGRLIYLWSKAIGERPITTKEITGLTMVKKLGDGPEGREFFELVCELAPGKGSDSYNAVALGHYLRRKEERMAGGLRLVQGWDKSRNVATWAVVAA